MQNGTKPNHTKMDNRFRTVGLALDHAGFAAASQNRKNRAMAPLHVPFLADVVKLSNGTLATEFIGALPYCFRCFSPHTSPCAKIAKAYMVQANGNLGHSAHMAKQTIQIGYRPAWRPKGMLNRGVVDDIELKDLKDLKERQDLTWMIQPARVAVRLVVEAHRQMIMFIGKKYSTALRVQQDMLTNEKEKEEEYGNILQAWLEKSPGKRDVDVR